MDTQKNLAQGAHGKKPVGIGRNRILPAITLGVFLACVLSETAAADSCAGVSRSESFRQMDREQLAAHREQVKTRTPGAVREALCESTAAITYTAYSKQLDLARREFQQAGGQDFDPAELYFFVECGEDRVNLSPLAYHAFNLNRDENGFIGELTLAVMWMSIGYLEIEDPARGRSFMDSVSRILEVARKNESTTEVEMYEDLLLQIEGFREDYGISVSECRTD